MGKNTKFQAALPPRFPSFSPRYAMHSESHDLPGMLPVAIIVDDDTVDASALLSSIVQTQRALGRSVHGLLMTRPNGGSDCSADMVLVDIQTQDQYLVSQRLGGESSGCRADPQGFARASRVLRIAMTQSPDLVISNRFGNLEAEGGGFHAELLELMANGIPLLTVVATRHLAAWREFSGGAGMVLPAQEAPILEWIEAITAAQGQVGAARASHA